MTVLRAWHRPPLRPGRRRRRPAFHGTPAGLRPGGAVPAAPAPLLRLRRCRRGARRGPLGDHVQPARPDGRHLPLRQPRRGQGLLHLPRPAPIAYDHQRHRRSTSGWSATPSRRDRLADPGPAGDGAGRPRLLLRRAQPGTDGILVGRAGALVGDAAWCPSPASGAGRNSPCRRLPAGRRARGRRWRPPDRASALPGRHRELVGKGSGSAPTSSLMVPKTRTGRGCVTRSPGSRCRAQPPRADLGVVCSNRHKRVPGSRGSHR